MRDNKQSWSAEWQQIESKLWSQYPPDKSFQLRLVFHSYWNHRLRVSSVRIRLYSPAYTGCPNKHGNAVTNSISSLLWINLVIPDFKRHTISFFMKTVNGCKDVFARWTVKTDKFSLFVYCNFLLLPSTTVSSQNINKQTVNIADENLTDYSFLSKYRYWIRHWIPIFIGTPCTRALMLHLGIIL